MTLAELKRNAAQGNMSLELIERYGDTGDALPILLRGVRKVIKVNSVGLSMLCSDGHSSEMRFKSAKLVEYDGDTLTIYEAGQRDLTEQEKQILAEWERIQAEYIARNPYSDTYWKKKDYFAKCPCPWLAGFETVRGKYYMYNGKVRDNQVRGGVILRYKVHRDSVEVCS